MLPGKKYTPEDYLQILWRRKWLAIVPFVIIASATVIATRFLPNVYQAETRVLIVPQQVPQSIVKPTITASLEERLQSLTQDITTRTRLERIIQELNLYQAERKTMIMEDVIEMMRKNILLNVARPRSRREEPGSFTITFQASDPRMAMQVTERLASLFINENLQNRTVQADQTNQFLQTQLEDARRRLLEQEKRLEAFRVANSGTLPSEVPANLQVMQGTQIQLQAVRDALNRDHDRELTIDKLIADMATIAAAPATHDGPQAPRTADEQLAQARTALQALQVRLKADHPDVIRAKRIVRELEAKADAEALNAPVGSPQAPAAARLTAADAKRLSELQAERESLERRIASNRDQESRLQATLASYRGKLEMAPTREAEQTAMMRDYSTLKQSYDNLVARAEQSKIAADLERRQIGEQFRIIDAARLPEKPISPDRLRLDLIGAFGGLAIGIALIALMEYRDTTFRTDDDVMISLALPVLAIVPVLASGVEVRHAHRRRIMAWSASAALLCVAAVAVAWKLDLFARLVP